MWKLRKHEGRGVTRVHLELPDYFNGSCLVKQCCKNEFLQKFYSKQRVKEFEMSSYSSDSCICLDIKNKIIQRGDVTDVTIHLDFMRENFGNTPSDPK